jgi:hypothetical protein
MMFSSNVCRFAAFSFLSLSANADTDTVRGVQRRLEPTVNLGDLGTLSDAGNYAILAKTGISTTGTTAIIGNIAVSPIAATAMTGFDLFWSGVAATSTLVTNGKLFASNYAAPTPVHLTTAVGAMETAYTDAAGRQTTSAATTNIGAGTLSGVTLTPGVYTFGSNVLINGDITIAGSNTDIFIIQITGNLIQAANKNVILTGGAKWENVFWQVAGLVEVGAGAHMEGTLLVKTAVTFITGSSLGGRVLAQTACVLQSATIDSSATTDVIALAD